MLLTLGYVVRHISAPESPVRLRLRIGSGLFVRCAELLAQERNDERRHAIRIFKECPVTLTFQSSTRADGNDCRWRSACSNGR
jgi:hypothetical protein